MAHTITDRGIKPFIDCFTFTYVYYSTLDQLANSKDTGKRESWPLRAFAFIKVSPRRHCVSPDCSSISSNVTCDNVTCDKRQQLAVPFLIQLCPRILPSGRYFGTGCSSSLARSCWSISDRPPYVSWRSDDGLEPDMITLSSSVPPLTKQSWQWDDGPFKGVPGSSSRCSLMFHSGSGAIDPWALSP